MSSSPAPWGSWVPVRCPFGHHTLPPAPYPRTCSPTRLDDALVPVGGRAAPVVTALSVTALIGSMLVAVALLVGLPAAAADPPSGSPVTVVSTGPGGAGGVDAGGALDVTADGNQVAFASRADLAGPSTPGGSSGRSRIYLRNLPQQTTTLVSDPADGDAGPPSVSATGRLVAYPVTTGQVTDIVVTDRGPTAAAVGTAAAPGIGGPAGPATHRATDVAGDLPLQRIPGCGPDCRPRLSADGSTLVFPAVLAAASPSLSLSVPGPVGQRLGPVLGPVGQLVDPVLAPVGAAVAPVLEGGLLDPLTDGLVDPLLGSLLENHQAGGASAGTVLDFGAPVAPGEHGRLGVEISNAGPRPVTMSTIAVAGGDGAFRVAGSDCARPLQPRQSCRVDLAVTPSVSGCPADRRLHALTGSLRTDSTTPDGQAVYPLVAECRVPPALLGAVPLPAGDAAYPPGGGSACPPADLTGLVPRPVAPSGGGGSRGTIVDAGTVELGQSALVALAVRAPDSAPLTFAAPPDCSVRLVVPPPAQRLGNAPAPCLDGGPARGCTAYLLLRPPAVLPSVGTLAVSGQLVRVATAGIRSVVLARRDRSGTGCFGCAGQGPATVVSVDATGAPTSGGEPSVSTTGRWVAFTSPASGSGQVFVHDTDRTGDASYQPGPTRTASVLPGGKAAESAGQPSLSGDGSRVAFRAVAVPDGVPQVYLRDLSTERTALVSAAAPAPAPHEPSAAQASAAQAPAVEPVPGDGPSATPALSADGRTVSFTSQAGDLIAPARAPGAAGAYARYLPDLAGGGVNQLLSGTATDAALPASDAHGRTVAFQTTAALVPEDTDNVVDAYAYLRHSALTLAPAAADFGRQPQRTVSQPRSFTVTNGGSGPLVVTSTDVSGPFTVTSDGCAKATLQSGGTCAVGVGFAPAGPGAAAGTLAVATADGPSTAQLGGNGTIAVLVLDPTLGAPGSATVVTGSGFPAGVAVELTWRPGLGQLTIGTDPTGAFTASMPILPNDAQGDRVLVASFPGGTVDSPPFLVVPHSPPPPG